jgi:hypothetical protein
MLRAWVRQHHDEDVAVSLTRLHNAIRLDKHAPRA